MKPSHEIVEALGWSLLHFLWQGAAVALLLWVLLLVTRKCSAHVRYAAAGVAFLAMLGALAATLAVLWPAAPVSVPDRAYVSYTPHAAYAVTAPPVLEIPISLTPPAMAPAVSAPPEPEAAPLRERIRPALPWCVGFWALGVVVFSLRFLHAWNAVRKWRTSGTPMLADGWPERFASLCARLNVSRPVKLLTSTAVAVPVVIGWLKPMILLPAGLLTGLSIAQLEAVLAHELAHVRRHDYLVNLLQNIVETLCFYHPAVWWVSRQLRKEREHCCDDIAASLTGGPLDYARALATLEEMRGSLNLGLSAATGPLLQRIRRLIGLPEEQSRLWPLGIVAVIALALGVPWALAKEQGRPAPAENNSKKGSETLPLLERGAGLQPASLTKEERVTPIAKQAWPLRAESSVKAGGLQARATTNRRFVLPLEQFPSVFTFPNPPIQVKLGETMVAAATGQWLLPDGVMVSRISERFPSEPRTAFFAITWPATTDSESHTWSRIVGYEGEKTTEPWLLVKESQTATLWLAVASATVRASLNNAKPRLTGLTRIDFQDPLAIRLTSWRCLPKDGPTGACLEAIAQVMELTTGEFAPSYSLEWAMTHEIPVRDMAPSINIASLGGGVFGFENKEWTADELATFIKSTEQTNRPLRSIELTSDVVLPMKEFVQLRSACQKVGLAPIKEEGRPAPLESNSSKGSGTLPLLERGAGLQPASPGAAEAPKGFPSQTGTPTSTSDAAPAEASAKADGLEARATREPAIKPGDAYLKAYLLREEGQKLAAAKDFTAAIEKLKVAQAGFTEIQQKFPEWQPEIVAFRIKRTSEELAKVALGPAQAGPSKNADQARANTEKLEVRLQGWRRALEELKSEKSATEAQSVDQRDKAAVDAHDASLRLINRKIELFEQTIEANTAEGQAKQKLASEILGRELLAKARRTPATQDACLPVVYVDRAGKVSYSITDDYSAPRLPSDVKGLPKLLQTPKFTTVLRVRSAPSADEDILGALLVTLTEAEFQLISLTTVSPLEFRLVGDASNTTEFLPGPKVRPGAPAAPWLNVERAALLNFQDVKSATAKPREGDSSHWEIAIELTEDGAKKLTKVSQENRGKALAIVADGVVLMAPTIRSEMGDQITVSGNFTEAEAMRVADGINHANEEGRPAPLEDRSSKGSGTLPLLERGAGLQPASPGAAEPPKAAPSANGSRSTGSDAKSDESSAMASGLQARATPPATFTSNALEDAYAKAKADPSKLPRQHDMSALIQRELQKQAGRLYTPTIPANYKLIEQIRPATKDATYPDWIIKRQIEAAKQTLKTIEKADAKPVASPR